MNETFKGCLSLQKRFLIQYEASNKPLRKDNYGTIHRVQNSRCSDWLQFDSHRNHFPFNLFNKNERVFSCS